MSGSLTNPPDIRMLNMSNWGGDFTLREAQLAYERGVRINSPGIGPGWYGQDFDAQADDSVAVGMKLLPYEYLEWDKDVNFWVNTGLDQCDSYPGIRYVSLDVEDARDLPGVDTRYRIQWLLEADRLVAARGYIPVIYTRRGYWNEYMAGTTLFSHRLLWDAAYGITPGRFIPYGGWTDAHAVIHQWVDTVSIAGQSCQPNWVEDWFLADIMGEGIVDQRLIDLLLRLTSLVTGDAPDVGQPGYDGDTVGWYHREIMNLDTRDVNLLFSMNNLNGKLHELRAALDVIESGDGDLSRAELVAALRKLTEDLA